MISRTIWDKSAEVNSVVPEKITSADLSQIAREKSSDYLLITYMQKFDFLFLACHCSLFPPTNDNLDQDWS